LRSNPKRSVHAGQRLPLLFRTLSQFRGRPVLVSVGLLPALHPVDSLAELVSHGLPFVSLQTISQMIWKGKRNSRFFSIFSAAVTAYSRLVYARHLLGHENNVSVNQPAGAPVDDQGPDLPAMPFGPDRNHVADFAQAPMPADH
jgi:hypothetical protein